MAAHLKSRYQPEIEARMQGFAHKLSEKDRRRYAALEARQLGGGIGYVAGVVGCSSGTIERGLDQLPHDPAEGRVRRLGGGRKKIESEPELVQNLKSVMETHTAGEPDDEGFLWTDFSPAQLADLGTPVCPQVIRDCLDAAGLALHKIAKDVAGGSSPDRDAQFQRIAELKAEYIAAGNPVFYMDTKAKECLGQLYSQGRVWTQRALHAFDHDFSSWATGVVIPHGIYDLALNRGHLNLGLSHDTSQFACDRLRWYWNRIGQRCYPNATSILLLCDWGGSNVANQYLFKHDLQELVNAIGLEIRVAHYSSYCSKYNPIERRFFPHVGRARRGVLFDTLDTVVRLIRKAWTTTGLKTTVNVIRRVYETGRQVAEEFRTSLPILFDKLLP